MNRVGSHVVFAWIHSKDVRIHCTDILIECRKISLFSQLYPESYTPFSSPHFPLSNATRIASLSFLL